MFGSGVFRGLGVTLKQFVGTYLDDIKKIPSRYAGGKERSIRQRWASRKVCSPSSIRRSGASSRSGSATSRC